MKRQRGRDLVVSLLATVLIVPGCSLSAPPASPAPLLPSESSLPTSVGTPSAASGALDHVVIIVEENKPAGGIIGSAAAPYLNLLAAEFALSENYRAMTHPSLPNYLALVSGTTAGITNDCNPPGGACQARVRSIAEEIDASGRTWKMYAEGMPAACAPNNSGRYAVKHNPFLYFPSVTKDAAYCARHVVPFTELSGDLATTASLPDFAFISPDLCNDMHDCRVRTGDAWLAQLVPKILASDAFTQQKSLLVITWDEGSRSDNRVSTIFAGPAARKGYRSRAAYNHYSLLHTIETAWGLPPLSGNDRNAPVMDDMLR